MRYNTPSCLRFTILALLFIVTLSTSPITRAQDLQTYLENSLNNLPSGSTVIGVHIKDSTENKVLAKIKEDRQFIPASNMKLVTTAAAVKILGADFVFNTRIYKRGNDLVLLGDGDPSTGDPKFLAQRFQEEKDDYPGGATEAYLIEIIQAVQKTGIKSVDRIYVDDRIFDREFSHPVWPKTQLNRWYQAEVGGLNFNDNCIDIYASPTRPSLTPRLRLIPDNPPVDIQVSAKTGNRNALWASREFKTNQINVRGEVKHALKNPIYVTFHDPPMFLGNLLKQRLEKAGIPVNAVVRPQDTDDLKLGSLNPIYKEQTTIKDVMRRTNEDSQNMFAEALIKRIGRHVTGRPGSWQTGAAAARNFLAKSIGKNAADIVISDGSGLSRENKITPLAMTKLLEYMFYDKQDGPTFINSMSIANNSAGYESRGQMKRRFQNYEFTGVVVAKSGYISGVMALSGYIYYSMPEYDPRGNLIDGTEKPRTIVFSVFFNEIDRPAYKARQWIESIVIKTDEILHKDYGYTAPIRPNATQVDNKPEDKR